MDSDSSLRIGELSARTGVSRHTIRFYERTGILPPPPRTRSGYRIYAPEAVDQVAFVKKAQALGLRLADVKEVLEISSGGRQPCEHVRERIEDRLREVETRRRELKELQGTLRNTLRLLQAATRTTSGCRCAVIDAAPIPGDQDRTKHLGVKAPGSSPYNP